MRRAFIGLAAALGMAAVVSCGDGTTAPVPRAMAFHLTLSADSAKVYSGKDEPSCTPYCFEDVPFSEAIPGRLVLRDGTRDLADDGDLIARATAPVVAAYDSVTFTPDSAFGVLFDETGPMPDSPGPLNGKAVVDSAGEVTIFVSAPPNGSTTGFAFQGKIDGDQFSGTWPAQLDPHGLGMHGTFAGSSTQ